MPPKSSSAKRERKSARDEEPTSVDFNDVVAEPKKEKRHHHHKEEGEVVDKKVEVAADGTKTKTKTRRNKNGDTVTTITTNATTLNDVLGTDKDKTIVEKTVSVRRKHRHHEPKESAAGPPDPSKPRRKRRGGIAKKKVVKKVIIKKHRSHKPEAEEPEPDPIIIRKRRVSKKKPAVKKVVRKVVVRRRGKKAGEGDAAAGGAEAEEPPPIIKKVRKHREHGEKKVKKVVQNVVTIIKKRVNPETGKVETYEEQVTAEEAQRQIEEAKKRKEQKLLEANEPDPEPIIKKIRKHKEGGEKKPKRVVQNVVTVIKKRVNPETGKVESYEEKQVVETPVDDDEEDVTSKSPKESKSKSSNVKSSSAAKSDAKPKKSRVVKHSRTSKEPEPDPEPIIQKIRKHHETTEKKSRKVIQNIVTVIKKRVNPETGQVETYEEKQVVETPVDEAEAGSSAKSSATKEKGSKRSSKKDSTAKKESSAKKDLKPKKSSSSAASASASAKKDSNAEKKSSATSSKKDSILIDEPAVKTSKATPKSSKATPKSSKTPTSTSKLSKTKKSKSSSVSSGGSVDPAPRKRRRRQKPSERVIEEIIFESDSEGDRHPVKKPRTIIEYYYSDSSEEEILEIHNVKIFISDSDDEQGQKNSSSKAGEKASDGIDKQRDISAILSQIDKSKKVIEEIIIDDSKLPQSIKNLVANDISAAGHGAPEEIKIGDDEFNNAALPPTMINKQTGKVAPEAAIAQIYPDLLNQTAFDCIADAAAKGVDLEEYLKTNNLDPATKAHILSFNQNRADQLRRMEKPPPMKKFQRTFGIQCDAEM